MGNRMQDPALCRAYFVREAAAIKGVVSYTAAVLTLLCCSLVPSRPANGQTPAIAAAPDYYDYDSTSRFTFSETPTGMVDGIRVLRIEYPSPVITPYAEDNTVTAYLFLPPGRGPHPAMVALHEWNPGSTNGGFRLCRAIASADVAALLVVEPFSLNRRANEPRGEDANILSSSVPGMSQALRQVALDVRRGLDYLALRPDVDPERLGLCGISLGGIVSGVVAKVDPRVKVVLSLAGGADFAHGFWNGMLTRKFRKGILRAGYTYETFRSAMIPFEAGKWSRQFDPDNALLIDGRYDLVVLPYQARALSDALGGAKIVWTNTGHYGMISTAERSQRLAVRFLRARFFGETSGYHPPDTLPSRTIKLGFLVGGHEGLSPVIATQLFNFDGPGRYSLDGQLTLHGLSAGLSARLTQTLSLGVEFPLLHGASKPEPYLLAHIVL